MMTRRVLVCMYMILGVLMGVLGLDGEVCWGGVLVWKERDDVSRTRRAGGFLGDEAPQMIHQWSRRAHELPLLA
jgi:hypothetical protein